MSELSVSKNPIPFPEPPWLLGLPSPYYNESHRRWQRTCREFIGEHSVQHAMEWKMEEAVPNHVYGQFSEARMLLPSLRVSLPLEVFDQYSAPGVQCWVGHLSCSILEDMPIQLVREPLDADMR